jgi:hypothetical protein
MSVSRDAATARNLYVCRRTVPNTHELSTVAIRCSPSETQGLHRNVKHPNVIRLSMTA